MKPPEESPPAYIVSKTWLLRMRIRKLEDINGDLMQAMRQIASGVEPSPRRAAQEIINKLSNLL